MIHALFHNFVSHYYFHIYLAMESHTIQSFPQKRKFQMSKIVHLVELDQQNYHKSYFITFSQAYLSGGK